MYGLELSSESLRTSGATQMSSAARRRCRALKASRKSILEAWRTKPSGVWKSLDALLEHRRGDLPDLLGASAQSGRRGAAALEAFGVGLEELLEGGAVL